MARRSARSVAVPSPDAPIDVIIQFAAGSYFGYHRHGGAEGLARVASAVEHRWTHEGVLPDRLGSARGALFSEALRWRHFGTRPHSESEEYMRALVARIAELSDGHVRQDRRGIGMWLRRAWRRLTRRR